MLYRVLRFLMRLSISAHYLEVKGIGMNNIPKKGPLMIAASHPNSFLDAIIIAVLINRPLHFLARSDVFKAKWSNYILRKLNLIPIYRLQEGHENLNRNDQTFKECHQILEQEGAILIFVEGLSLTDMKLRPLKKGLARIALNFVSEYAKGQECYVAPIALNYDRPTEFRSKVTAAMGEVVKVSDYVDIYNQNHNQGFLALNKTLFKELKSHTVEVEDSNYMVYKAMSELDSCFKQNSLSRKILIAEQIQSSFEIEGASSKELSKEIHQCFGLLKKYKLNFRKLKTNTGISITDLIVLIIGLPFALACFTINFLPLVIAKQVADTKVKLDEFYASVRLVLGSLLWLIYTSITTIFMMVLLHPIFIILPILMYSGIRFFIFYYEKLNYTRSAFLLGKLKKDTNDYTDLQHSIKQIYRLRKDIGLSPNES